MQLLLRKACVRAKVKMTIAFCRFCGNKRATSEATFMTSQNVQKSGGIATADRRLALGDAGKPARYYRRQKAKCRTQCSL